MICQNCRTEVNDDLIFCTNCGERLIDSKNEAQTVLIKDSVVTQSTTGSPAPKPASNLKWVALIVALIAVPASIFGVYLLTKSDNNGQVSQNTNKPKTPAPTATRSKANTNQNSNANISDTNTANANVNADTNWSNLKNITEIMDERLEIAPKSHYALPFVVYADTVKIIGEVKVLAGERIDGFVYTQKSYDENFPDPTYKMFSFEGRKTADVNQTLVEEEYVLVFVNNSEKPIIIQSNFSLE